MVSCVISNCTATSNGLLSDNSVTYNCTIVDAGAAVRNGSSVSDPGYIRNTVVVGSLSGSTLNADQAYNSLYSSSTAGQGNITTCSRESPVKFAGEGSLALALDSAGYRLSDAEYLKSVMDFNGDPFVFGPGGAYTAGAVERNWKSDLVAAAGRRALLSVSSMTTAAYATDGGVFLPGGSLDFRWAKETGGECCFNVNVTGSGTLAILLNGAKLGIYEADFSGEVVFRSVADANDLTFRYEPGCDDDGGVLLSRFRHRAGFKLTIR